MIPLKIHLKNFLSYGYPTQIIDFEPYQLICLSGKNGHGKSALLDAITWVLWGQARKIAGTAKADEGLVRLGQHNMMVSLDFICNNETYRVKREFTLSSNKSYTNVEFGILDVSGNYKSLSDKTIRGTQEKIEKVIGLTFETCINSIFLRQGQSHEFSKKSAKERKDILCSILGLEHFETLKKKILDAAKNYHNEKEYLTKTNQRLSQEIQQASHLAADYQAVSNHIKNCTQEEYSLNNNLQKLDSEKKILELEHTQLQMHVAQHARLQTALIDRKKQIITSVAAWRTINNKKINAPHFSKQQQDPVEKEFSVLQERYAQHIKAQEKIINLRQQLTILTQELQKNFTTKITQTEQQVTRLQTEQIIAQQQLTEQEQLVTKINKNELDLHQKKLLLEKTINNNLEQSKQLASQEEQFEKRKNFYHRYSTKVVALQDILTTASKQRHTIADQAAPHCPLCKQELNKQLQHDVLVDISAQEDLILHQKNRISRVIMNLKEVLINQRNNIEIQKKQQHASAHYTAQLAHLVTQVEELTEQKKLVEKKVQDISQNIKLAEQQLQEYIVLRKNLEQKFFKISSEQSEVKMLTQEILVLEEKIKVLSFDYNKYEKTQKALEEFNKYRADYNLFQEELAGQAHRKNIIHALIEEYKKFKQEFNLLHHTISSSTIIRRLELLEKEQMLLKNNLNILYEQKNNFLQQKGRLEQQQTTLIKYQEESVSNQQKIIELEKQLEDLQALSQALSKDGIQALLIEDALPELEYDANILLSKLTDNQAQIHIESLKDLKSGGIRETLVINISDAIGIRPYELFSGGEAFRIDFALRIALSQLLARRAGTSLQTLIIDEGFGSQDEEGLAHIMDALHKIQDSFSKIIIVSHLASMKDQFPTQFFVHKGPQGSTVNIVHQG